MASERPAIWTRAFVAALGINLVVTTVFYLLMTSTALYATIRFAAGDDVAGAAAGCFLLGSLIARVVTGKYLDLLGRRPFILASLSLFAAASFAYPFLATIPELFAIRAGHGFAFGAASTSITVVALSLVPPDRRAEGTGYFGVASTVAAGVGPVTGAVLLQEGAYDAVFWASGAVSLIAAVSAPFLRFGPPLAEHHRTGVWRVRMSDLIDRRALRISTIAFLGCLCFSGVLTFLMTYARSVDAEQDFTLFYAIYSAVVLIARLSIGKLQDRYGDTAVLVPIIVALAAGLTALSLPPSLAVVIGAAVLIGVGFGTLIPSTQAIAIAAVPPHRIAVALSTYYLLTDAAIAIGPAVLGALLSSISYTTMYLMLGAVMLIALAIYPWPRSADTMSA